MTVHTTVCHGTDATDLGAVASLTYLSREAMSKVDTHEVHCGHKVPTECLQCPRFWCALKGLGSPGMCFSEWDAVKECVCGVAWFTDCADAVVVYDGVYVSRVKDGSHSVVAYDG